MSWKKYGGTNKLDKINNITVNAVVTDRFTLKDYYSGDWDISGGLSVRDNGIISQNLDVYGNIFAHSNLDISGALNILQNTSLYGNLLVKDSATIWKNVYLDFSGSTLLHGENRRFGLNTLTPQATLDISGDLVQTIDIHTSTDSNKNVIARNVTNQGITVNIEPNRAYFDFYVDNSMNLNTENYNARILYDSGGLLTFDVSGIAQFKPRSIFSNDLTKSSLYGERISVYNSPEDCSQYLKYAYANTQIKTSTGLSLYSCDNSSNTVIRLGTESGKSLGIVGGAYKQNTMMGTIALMDGSGVYPAINAFSGNLLSNLKTSIGINKYEVSKHANGLANKYAMDINGPSRFGHQELLTVADVSFEIQNMWFYGDFGIAVGKSYKTTTPYEQATLITTDGGFTWTQTRILDNVSLSSFTDLENSINTLNSVFILNTSLSIIVGTGSWILKSINQGNSWSQIIVPGNLTYNFTSVYLNTNKMVLGFTDSILDASFGKIINALNTDASLSDVNVPLDTGLSSVNAITGQNLLIFIAGNNGIRSFNISSSSFGTIVGSGNAFYGINSFYGAGLQHIVAVGTNLIYYTHNSGTNWIQVSLVEFGTFRSVWVYNDLCAIAVGDSGLVAYSIDGFATWRKMSADDLNLMGNGVRITNTNLSNIRMVGSNHFIISGIRTGQTEMFNLYAPYFFSRSTNHVIEASGNMVISGDIQINDNGALLSNNSQFRLFPENVSQLYLGNTAIGGKTNILNNLDVCGNTVVYGNSSVYSNLFVSGNTTVSNYLLVTGNTRVADLSGQNIDLSGNLIVHSNINSSGVGVGSVIFDGGVSIAKDVNVNGNVYLNNTLDSVSDITSLSIGGNNATTVLVGSRNTTHEIRIGTLPNNVHRSSPNVLDVYIGDMCGNVIIFGNLTIEGALTVNNVNNLEIKNKTILLNDENPVPQTSSGVGLLIHDGADDNAGYFIVNEDMTGYLLKAPLRNNVINLDVSGLYIGTESKGFVVIQPNDTDINSSNYTITAGTIDISDIDLLDASLNSRMNRNPTLSTVTNQVADTTISTPGLFVNKLESQFIPNTSMDISGNTIISKLGLGTIAVNSNYVLDISGTSYTSGNIVAGSNINLMSGFIYQW